MKKKIILVLLSVCLSVSLAACGETKVESKKEVVTKDNTGEHGNNSSNEVDEPETSEESTDESTVGTVESSNGLTKIPVITDKELNYTGSAGPINYSIDAIQISKLTATTDDMATMLDIEKDKEVALVVIDVTVENTSDDDVNFYMDQAVLVSNTKEQVDADMLLSDYMGGEYLGQVLKSGTLMYILPNSNADDITDIKFRVSAPIDSDWNSLSDDITIELTFK